MLFGSKLEEITSTSTVQRRLNGSSFKIPVNCPSVINLHNSKLCGVGLMDQLKSAYQLDQKQKFRFYLRLFFDLFNVAPVNFFIVYKKLENKDLILKEFKICVAIKAIKLITSCISQKFSCSNHRSSKCLKAENRAQYLNYIFPFP